MEFFLIGAFVVLILASVTVGYLNSYWNNLQSTRDNQRKADLSLIQNALEKYYGNNGKYPDIGVNNGWLNLSGETSFCDPLGCDANVYLKQMPKDPDFMKGCQYYYRHIGGQKEYYELYSTLDKVDDNDARANKNGYDDTNCNIESNSGCICKYRITSVN